MKANEFVKEYGIDIARECLEDRPKTWETCYLKLSNFELVKYIPSPLDFIDVDDLKRLVQSHELVESYGGLDSAKSTVNYPNFLNDEDVKTTNHRLSKAIADVESCQ